MRKRNAILKAVLSAVLNFAVFFLTISFVVTCTFLVFFSSVSLSESDIRAFAPVVFFNIFILSALFVISDAIRRQITVEYPVKEIQKTLKKLMQGDFDARISIPKRINKENRFSDIAESINLLAEELSGVETLRTDFIANVSHELKTPLAVIGNYATILQSPDLSEEKRLEYSKAISEASRRLATLITNILKLNKLENQQIFPKFEKFNLTEQLCECLLQFENEWEKKNININTDMREDVLINSDPELLSLVWNNLFSNAIKFTGNGGAVNVSLSVSDKHITVKVSDTGCGIKPKVGEHIFEKFYQCDTSHSGKGNGLGLALVKRVIDIIQGEIKVESIYGEGSTFTVKIRRY